jgi:hypothetical protein
MIEYFEDDRHLRYLTNKKNLRLVKAEYSQDFANYLKLIIEKETNILLLRKLFLMYIIELSYDTSLCDSFVDRLLILGPNSIHRELFQRLIIDIDDQKGSLKRYYTKAPKKKPVRKLENNGLNIREKYMIYDPFADNNYNLEAVRKYAIMLAILECKTISRASKKLGCSQRLLHLIVKEDSDVRDALENPQKFLKD